MHLVGPDFADKGAAKHLMRGSPSIHGTDMQVGAHIWPRRNMFQSDEELTARNDLGFRGPVRPELAWKSNVKHCKHPDSRLSHEPHVLSWFYHALLACQVEVLKKWEVRNSAERHWVWSYVVAVSAVGVEFSLIFREHVQIPFWDNLLLQLK